MKKIELTDEHKKMFKEMLIELFPKFEFDFSYFDDNFYQQVKFWNKSMKYAKFIHWFEFCTIHLVEKILNPNPKKPSRMLKEHFNKFYWLVNLYANNLGGKHPIDYLYEEFKKLKVP